MTVTTITQDLRTGRILPPRIQKLRETLLYWINTPLTEEEAAALARPDPAPRTALDDTIAMLSECGSALTEICQEVSGLIRSDRGNDVLRGLRRRLARDLRWIDVRWGELLAQGTELREGHEASSVAPANA